MTKHHTEPEKDAAMSYDADPKPVVPAYAEPEPEAKGKAKADYTALDHLLKDVEKCKTPPEAVVMFVQGIANLLHGCENMKAASALAEELDAKTEDIAVVILVSMPLPGSGSVEGGGPSSFRGRKEFDAWLASFNGGNTVSLDGMQVKEGHGNTMVFHSHSATGMIDTKAPTD